MSEDVFGKQPVLKSTDRRIEDARPPGPFTIQTSDGATTTYSISPRDIIPEDDRNELIQLRDRSTAIYFRVGDIANHLFEMLKANRVGMLDKHRDFIYAGVGYWYGRSARTVRYYADVSRFFPADLCYKCGTRLQNNKEGGLEGGRQFCPKCEEISWDIRKEYEELPFAYFVISRQFGGQWREFLNYALLNPQLDRWSVARNFIEATGIGSDVRLPDPSPPVPNMSGLLSQSLSGGGEPGERPERLEPDRVLPVRTMGELAQSARVLSNSMESVLDSAVDDLASDTVDSVLDAIDALKRAAELLERDSAL